MVKSLRNDLAHGSLSFAECGAGTTVKELRDIANWTATYLREVVAHFVAYISSHEFLVPGARPTSVQT